MKVCQPLFLLLFLWLPLRANLPPEPQLPLGLNWGMDQHEVEKALEKNEDVIPHGGYIIINVGDKEYYCRRYGTYLVASVPMDLICGFDTDYTSLRLIMLRYRAGNFNRAQEVYFTVVDFFTKGILGRDSERHLRDRERRLSRQDLSLDWRFPDTRFHMRVWGSDANGHVTIWFSRVEDR